MNEYFDIDGNLQNRLVKKIIKKGAEFLLRLSNKNITLFTPLHLQQKDNLTSSY